LRQSTAANRVEIPPKGQAASAPAYGGPRHGLPNFCLSLLCCKALHQLLYREHRHGGRSHERVVRGAENAKHASVRDDLELQTERPARGRFADRLVLH
jgi:hypothetical protein